MTKKNSFSMDSSGFDKFKKRIDNLKEEKVVALTDIFGEVLYDKFIAHFNITCEEDAEQINEEEKDRFAIENSEYESFEDLVYAKGREYLINKINFG